MYISTNQTFVFSLQKLLYDLLLSIHSFDRKSIDTIRFYAGRSVRFSTQRKNRAGKISHAAIKTANRVRRSQTLRGSHHTRQCLAFSGFVWLLAFGTLRIAITIKRSIGTDQIYQCIEQSQPHATECGMHPRQPWRHGAGVLQSWQQPQPHRSWQHLCHASVFQWPRHVHWHLASIRCKTRRSIRSQRTDCTNESSVVVRCK